MGLHYHDERRRDEVGYLPHLETFQKGDEWFYWFCIPGCLPEGDEVGPFDTEEEALEHARLDLEDEPQDMTDVEADADTLKSAGWGTDEDYGYYGED